jgi:serine/threonine protein kinase
VHAGGQLLDRVIKGGTFTEAKAAALMRTIISVVAHCHHMGVIHRDIKCVAFSIIISIYHTSQSWERVGGVNTHHFAQAQHRRVCMR